jgi:YVTN family beta-propeller protein
MPGAEKGTTMRRLVRSSIGIAVVAGLAFGAQHARAGQSGRTGPAGRSAAGTNLLANPGAQLGAASAQGWDSVTIPRWRIVKGLPTVVTYGTAGFPGASGRFPADRGGRLFSGGVGGTAVLSQQVRLQSPAGQALRRGTRYRLSGWLRGTKSSRASVTVRFLSAAGRTLAQRTIGPVGKTGPSRSHSRLVWRSSAGLLPRGAVRATVTMRLGSSLPGFDGYQGALAGYNRALADGLRLTVSAPALRVRVRPPVAHVPRYQHVFLFYFENQDYGSLIGNTSQAPYLNGLLPSASLLERTFAEEHPSDANYLALAGGSAFGVPLTDPLEINPLYTIRARNITDLLVHAHQSWKGYLQSANGPCDDTVHGSYWNDDLPLLYFADIRNRPGYCARHVVPLEALRTDLAHTATTPSFAWIGPNDCSDMEGCGIHAGDRFLASQLGAVLRSPAWRTQRSLAIITVDEDAYNHPDPPQRVATLLLASTGVRHGYVSHARYTHYSLLRTIEAALGLPTLTANDRWAQPVNDVFRRGAGPAVAPRQHGRAGPATAGAAPAGGGTQARGATTAPAVRATATLRDRTAFVVNSGSGSVTPVDLRTRHAGRPIKVGAKPTAIVAAPDGRTLYVADSGAGAVTPIGAATRRAGHPIKVGGNPRALALTPDGKTLYVANSASGTVTPVSTSDGRPGQAIAVGRYPRGVVISPDGKRAYVLDWGSGEVTPISTRHNRALPPIRVGSYPFAAAFAPDGKTLYVACYGSDTVVPISVPGGHAGRPVRVGAAPDALAVARDGKTVYAVSGDAQSVTPISVASWRAGRPIRAGYSPADIALSGSGATAYVVNTISGSLTPIATATGRAGRPISVGVYGYPTAIGLDGRLAVVLDTYSGRAALVDTRTRRELRQVVVGSGPVAVAFAGGGK